VWAQIGSLTVTRPASFLDASSLAIDVRREMEIAPGVELLGWDSTPESVRPGETLALTLYWQATNAARSAFTIRALLTGEAGETLLWSGTPVDDRYPANRWAEGEVLVDRVRWKIPRGQRAGRHTLSMMIGDQAIILGQVAVAGVPRLFDPPPVGQLMNVNFGNQILLYGSTLQRIDANLSLEIVWQALDNIPVDYKVFVHLVGVDGTLLTQRDAMPQADTYPTSWWLPGEFVVDTFAIPAPDSGYALRVGLYAPENGNRLPIVEQGQNSANDYVELLVK
jgi:hypothetical protein